MKKLFLGLSIIFGILTFVGAGYMLIDHGQVNVGYFCIPMVVFFLFGFVRIKIKELRWRLDYEKEVLGSALLLSGVLVIAIFLASSMSLEWNHNGQFSAIWNNTQYGLMPAV